MLRHIISFAGFGPDMETEIVFIGGVGRSGTSITRELLGSHSDVYSLPFEYRFIVDPDGIIDYINQSLCTWSPYLADRRLKRLEKFLLKLGRRRRLHYFFGSLIRSTDILKSLITTDSYHGWELEQYFPRYTEQVKNLIERLKCFEYSGSWAGADRYQLDHRIYYSPNLDDNEIYSIFSTFINELFDGFFYKINRSLFVEDNTWNLLFVKELNRLFPKAKFIHVYRDPRDIVSSFSKQRWMPNCHIESAKICGHLFEEIIRNTAQLDSKRFMQISIEQMVLEKESTIKKLGNFLNLKDEEQLMKFPLSSSSFGRWKVELDSKTLAKIEPYIREYVEHYEYKW